MGLDGDCITFLSLLPFLHSCADTANFSTIDLDNLSHGDKSPFRRNRLHFRMNNCEEKVLVRQARKSAAIYDLLLLDSMACLVGGERQRDSLPIAAWQISFCENLTAREVIVIVVGESATRKTPTADYLKYSVINCVNPRCVIN